MPPRGRTCKVGQTRMHGAIDNLSPMGFSPDSVRAKVKTLLHVYGEDEAWPVIEEASYRLVIETLLEDQQLQNQDEPEGEDTGAQVSVVGEQLEGEPSCTANEHPSSDPQDTALSSPITVEPEPVTVPSAENSNPTTEQSQVEAVVNATEDVAALIEACGHTPPPGFEHVTRQDCERRKHKPGFGWIKPKDYNDFVLLKPYPVQPIKRPRNRVSRWDMRPNDVDDQVLNV